MSKTTTTVVRFNSIEELVRDNERWGKDATDGASSHQNSASWAGTDTYEEAVALMQHGWPEGAARVGRVRSSLERAVESLVQARSQDIQFGYEGEWVDIGRLAEGDPECCGYWSDDGEDNQKKVIKIVANICVSGSISTDAMFARGAACVAAVDLLESLGHRVELWVGVGCNRYDEERLDSQVLVKDAGQPVDTDRLAYVLCHPAFFRRVYFAHMELNRMTPCGCLPCGVTADNAIVLPEALASNGLSHDDIVRQVVDICDRAGVTFDPAQVMDAVKA